MEIALKTKTFQVLHQKLCLSAYRNYIRSSIITLSDPIILLFLDGPPSKISTLKRDDIDRIYSEYVKITLKSSENTKAKPQMVVKSSKSDGSGNPERVKRKYKKRQKEQHVVQNNSVSLLKPAGQSQPGKYTIHTRNNIGILLEEESS